MIVRVSPQSIIDIITNSSTEIFTFPSCEASDLIAQIVDTVLQEAGSDKKFNDLYSIVTVPSIQAMDDYIYWLEDNENLIDSSYINKKDIRIWIKENPEKSEELFHKFVMDSDKYSYRPNMAIDIEIRNKDGASNNLDRLIRNVFESTEVET